MTKEPSIREMNLLKYYKLAAKYRKMIAITIGSVSVAAVIISLMLPKSFRADAVIMPLSSKSGVGGTMSALASQFGGYATLAGLGVPVATDDTAKLMAIFKSRTLAENVIARENLLPILFEDKWDKKNQKWKISDEKKIPNMQMGFYRLQKYHMIFLNDKKLKLIRISGIFKTPELAARVVNTYVEELQKFIHSNAFTMAKRNRIFIEGQLEENRKDLLEAGKEINEYYTNNNISSSEAKIDVVLNPPQHFYRSGNANEMIVNDRAVNQYSTASLDTDISNQVSQMENADISDLLAQKSDIERRIADATVVKNVPQQVFLSYLMLKRELLTKINGMLTSQYEVAKIEESKEDLSFQVIDKAVPPWRRFKPMRSVFCIKMFILAVLISAMLVYLREYIARMRQLHSEQ